MVTKQRLLTYEDYVARSGDEPFELIRGELIEVTGASRVHQEVLKRLFRLLDSMEAAGAGQVFLPPFDVKLSDIDVLEPDLVFVSQRRINIVRDRFIDGAPDIVVEILSDSTRKRDVGVKRTLYAAAGVREYWIIDPSRQRVDMLLLHDHGFVPIEGETAEGRVTSTVLPTLTIDPALLFAGLPNP